MHIVIDEDDKSMNNYDTLGWLSDNGVNYVSVGETKNKIDAVNRDLKRFEDKEWSILVAMSDDFEAQVQGFDEIIRRDMRANFPDLDGVLHYNDGVKKSNIMTMTIMGRRYFERTNYIYHPDYTTVDADVEATEVAYMLGKYKYMGNDLVLFKHMHHLWGLSQKDDLYIRNEKEEDIKKDRATLLRRRAIKYGLPLVDLVNDYKYANVQ